MNSRYQDILRQEGYVKFQLADVFTDIHLEAELKAIGEAFDQLPVDAYAPEFNRYRRYSRAVILPRTGQVEWLPNTVDAAGQPVQEYFQGPYNPEYAGSYRRFPPLSEKIKANRLVERIIQFDFCQTFWDERDILLPVHVGVHFVKLKVETDEDEALSSPNCLHQDGEPFTFVHLIRRKNVTGGVNTIAEPACAGRLPHEIKAESVRASFTLKDSLESYGVCDQKVSHYVSPVKKGSEGAAGERSAILIDFQPTVVAPLE